MEKTVMEKTVLLKFSAEVYLNLPRELNGKVDEAVILPREEQIKGLVELLKEEMDAKEAKITNYELLI